MPAVGNLIHQTSETTGTGNFAIALKDARRAFSDEFSTGGNDVFDYFITHSTADEWERGTGSLLNSSTLVRDTVLESSNSGNPVDFSAGVKDVMNDVPAAKQVQTDLAQTLTSKTLTAPVIVSGVLNTGVSGSAVLDEDNMASDSDAHLATQQSIKAYVDANAGSGTVDTSGVPVANDFARFTDADTIEGRSYAEVRADLDLEVGVDVQAYDANLPTWPVGVDATEVGYLNGVTSAIQTQLDAKAASSHNHAASDVTSGTFDDARVAESNVTQHEGAIDHGSVAGLADDDHTQYSIISSGAGVPATTPSRVGAIYVDTTNDNVYIATDTASSADWDQATGGAGGGLSDVVDDTTPQLGGSLDVNGQKIVSASNGNIDIEPNGTGNVLLGNFTFDADQTVGAGQDDYVLTYDNSSGLISLEAGGGGSIAPLVVEGANEVAQRNSTNAQEFYVYNTYTDASNYERAAISWNSNVLEIGTQAAGTGTGRGLQLLVGGELAGNIGVSSSTATLFGYQAGDSITGNRNAAFGHSAASGISTGSENVVVGMTACSGINPSNAVIIGAYALGNGSGGDQNMVVIGRGCARYAANISDTVAIGSECLAISDGADFSVFIGKDAGKGTSYGTVTADNVVIGYQAGYLMVNGADDNVLIGYKAGDSITTGSGNIIIGHDQDTPAATTSDHLNLGGILKGDLTTTVLEFGTHTALGAETLSGYIEIKDAGGTTRKLAVIS